MVMWALAADAAVDDVGEGSCAGSHCGEHQVEPADDLLVPVARFGEVGVDVANEFAALAAAELVEVFGEGHAHRVAPLSLPGIFSAMWLSLPVGHRLLFEVAVPLGCLLFMVLGAVMC